MQYRAVLFSFRDGTTRDVYWEGPDYVTVVGSLEAELACGQEFTDTQEIEVGGVKVLMWYTGPCDPQPKQRAWRLGDNDHWSNLHFGNAAFFPPEDPTNNYSGWVEGDCPLTSTEIAAHIVLLEHSEDFSEFNVICTASAE